MSADRPPEARHAHLVGIGGAGLGSLARWLRADGWGVTGSDATATGGAVERLRGEGFAVSAGHLARNLPSGATRVIHSTAVPLDVPELQAARERNLPVQTYFQALGELADQRRAIAVSGTHGKTTTTCMLGWILSAAGRDPSWIAGGVVGQGVPPWRHGEGPDLVVEACELQCHFLHIHGRIEVVTNIDDDHLECFGSREGVRAAFARFAGLLPPDGLLIRPAGTDLGEVQARQETFALEGWRGAPAARWRAEQIRRVGHGTTSVVRRAGRAVAELTLRVPGRHNVADALAALAAAAAVGVRPAEAARALEGFPGVGRRLELRGEVNGAPIYDDYAHHPRAVKVAVRTVRAMYPDHRLVVLFEPHQHRRLRDHMARFAAALAPAQVIVVTEAFAAREESVVRRPSGSDLVGHLVRAGRDARFAPSVARGADLLARELRPGDVALLLGAGDIARAAELLRRHTPARAQRSA